MDLSGYSGKSIIEKHAIDNSCGDGAFLCEIVRRYCEASIQLNRPLSELRKDLETYIHGIDIDHKECQKCIENVNKVAISFGISNITWDITCADALTTDKYDGKMHFVLGNPPYIRVHNLGQSFDKIKSFSFAKRGMTDLFIVFYEIGIKMLSTDGTLGYITPSSFFNSLAGCSLRKALVDGNYLDKIVDLKHFQAFSSTTYTTIAIIKKSREKSSTDYYEYDTKNCIPYYVDSLMPSDYYIRENYFFASQNDLSALKKILSSNATSDIAVKNGYATLCDSVFIHNFEFSSQYVIPVIKASKGIKNSIFYPYDSNGKLISEKEIKEDAKIYKYLTKHKSKLMQRSHEKEEDKYWYSFGRSQAINDTFKDKLTVNTLIRTVSDLKFVKAGSGVGVYGGLYITSDTIPFDSIINVLKSNEFIKYVSLLGKYKSGGYIRSNSIPYFQIFIIFEKVPYYKDGGIFDKYDVINQHNLDKYFALSKDNPDAFYHTPDKTLLILLKLKEKSPDFHFANSRDYASYYKSKINDKDLLAYSTKIKDTFSSGVILNDYANFIKRTRFIVEGKAK